MITGAAAGLVVAVGPAAAVDFNRDIRPILSDRCFQCHGPDGAARQAGLRLDTPDGAFAPRRDDRAAVTPGDPAASLLLERITAAHADDRMPPPGSNKTLREDEIELLRRWIEAGATWQTHWSFVPPAPVPPPAVGDESWPRNPVDRFVLARLEAEGLAPADEATRETLLRRVTFDLTGLPPTLAEIDAFLADESPDAYERVVDRLLASPRYGERMAMAWLDVARYADTHGYHYDNERTMWPWRDWVIDAYNRNLPFDAFTVQQLAGDLLPGATLDQRIATGFNRNHGISWEGGIIPEEYLVEYVVDRVQTTSTAWLGLTVGCARCHEHKFDPVSQREFYEFAAFFNTIPEKGADGLEGNAVPLISAPVGDDATRLADLEAGIARLEEAYDAPRPELDEARARWERETADAWERSWTILPPFAAKAAGGAELVPQDDGSVFAEGPHPQIETYEIVAFTDLTDIRAIRLDAMADERLPRGGPGRAFHANYVLSELEVEIAPVADPAAAVPVELVAAHADHSQPGFFVGRTVDGSAETGWAVERARFGEDRVAVFVPRAPFGFESGTALRFRLRYDSPYRQHAMGRVRLAVTTDAALAAALAPCELGPWRLAGPFPAESAAAARATDFGPEASLDTVTWTPRPDLADGVVHALPEDRNAATYLHRTITSPDERRVVLSFGSDDALAVWVNREPAHASDAPRGAAPDQDLVTVRLRPGRNDLLVKVTNFDGPSAVYFEKRDDDGLDPPLPVMAKLQRAPDERGDDQRRELRDHYLAAHSDEARALLADLADRRAERDRLTAAIPTVMVMQEMDEPRPTFMLGRGRYDQPGEQVTPGVPGVLPGLPADAPADRLGLARWLTDPGHPLTARVAVNRHWQMHFGRGLVDTPDDFGAQGSPPSHPALLDWLALELVRSGWDVKAMHRLIVTSATYRQSSAAPPALRARDPGNRLLARGPRFRLPAEMIRDAALAASGLLVERVGGPPVKPYQPEGLWKEVGSDFEAFSANVYRRGTGDDLYRRSMYTFWKRTLPPPALQTFDAPTRELCVVRRSRTNTPLQALVLMNDPTYVEAARFLAQRTLREVDDGAGALARAAFAFRVVTSRRPTPREVALLVGLYREQHAAFGKDPELVRGLLGVGDGTHPADLDRTELAAWTVVATTLLNLDEAITKG
ncbi:MAG: DUF1553 domain-containing protein [Planctomycetota bacterium]|jgi:mono/diheme cytochrome c family protein